MLKTTITAGMLLAVAFLFTAWMPTPAQALMSKHRCDFCHDLHSAAGGSLTNRATTGAVCRACHAASVDGRNYGTDTDTVLTVAAAAHTTPSYSSPDITCLDCHNPHDYEPTDDPATPAVETNDGDRDSYQNLDLVRRAITVPFSATAVFYSADDYSNGIDGDGVCQICHTLTRFQLNDGSFSNHPMGGGATCTASCHTHANGFDR